MIKSVFGGDYSRSSFVEDVPTCTCSDCSTCLCGIFIPQAHSRNGNTNNLQSKAEKATPTQKYI